MLISRCQVQVFFAHLVAIIMPSTKIISENSLILGVREEVSENLSNFGTDVASVKVTSNAGGPGLLLQIERHHNNNEQLIMNISSIPNISYFTNRTIFGPMAEVSSTVENFLVSINQQFPSGALFLLLSDYNFQKLMMELTNKMMERNEERQFYAARLIGQNTIEGKVICIMSQIVQMKSDGGELSSSSETPFLWLQ